MLCPKCKHNTLEPIYSEVPNFNLIDHPLYRNIPVPPIKVLRHFHCSHCQEIYYTHAGESAEQAYWRIIRDYDYTEN